jgi:hypothetical protein
MADATNGRQNTINGRRHRLGLADSGAIDGEARTALGSRTTQGTRNYPENEILVAIRQIGTAYDA